MCVIKPAILVLLLVHSLQIRVVSSQANTGAADDEPNDDTSGRPSRLLLESSANNGMNAAGQESEPSPKFLWNYSRQPATTTTSTTGEAKTWRIPKQWSPRRRSGQIFGEWSPWTPCDGECRQKRERICNVPRKCSDTRHVEERRCTITTACKEREGDVVVVVSDYSGHHHRSRHDHQEQQQQQTNHKAGARPEPPHQPEATVRWGSAGGEEEESGSAANKFGLKPTDESEVQIIKINHKKTPPEIRANKFDFARPVMSPSSSSIQHQPPPTHIHGGGDSDGFEPELGLRSLFGANETTSTSAEDTDEYPESGDDYPADGIVHFKRKYSKKFGTVSAAPSSMGNFVTAENSLMASPKGAYRVYTRWSKWSKCSGKCTTRRFKKCRMKEICGAEVLREVAYCYTEGSFCEEWIVRQMYSNVPRSPPSAVQQYSQMAGYPSIDHQQRNSYQERKLPSKGGNSVQGGQCGIASAVGSRRKPASHMLRIIGGRVVRRGSYPWQVAILNRFKEAFCGGTLISKQWILTAAHCVRKRLYVRLGEHNLEERDGTEVEYRVEYAIRHPYYDKKTVDNDIALLRLPKEIIPSAYIGLACLPQKYQRLPIGTKCTIIGWGKRKNMDDAGTIYLHEAQVPIVNNEACKEVYDDYTITNNMFCAGHKRGRIDTCSGDSGGPLLCKDPNTSQWSILGVTSFGDGCGKRNKFGIYTKVSNYVDWIQSVIDCNGNCRRF